MNHRSAAILVAALATLFAGSASAADLAVDVPLAGAGRNCDSGMITVYDFQPGVVTRHWKDCECRYAPAAPLRRPVSGLPAFGPQFEPMIEPWRK